MKAETDLTIDLRFRLFTGWFSEDLLQRRLAGGPARRAELAGLERLQGAQDFLNRAADGERVDAHPLQDALGVDQEGTAESDALLFQQHIVVAADLEGRVGEDREF